MSTVLAGRAGSSLPCPTYAVGVCLSVLQASLQGPEVQITLPSEDDISAFTNPTSTSSTSSSSSSSPLPGSSGNSWSSAAVTYTSPPAAGGGGPGSSSSAAVGADLEKKAASVVVFEGQTLSWTLSLTNISSQPITGCKVGYCGRCSLPASSCSS